MGTTHHARHFLGLSAALAALLATAAASGAPTDKVYTPSVDYREFEIEFRAGAQDEGQGYERAFVLDLGYGVTPWWFTEVVFEYEGVSGEGGELEAVEWENIFALSEPGQYWADFGVFAEYEYTREAGEPDEFKIGPMLQKEFGKLQANVNLLLEREVGANRGKDTDLDYSWQLKWRGNPRLEFGVQGLGGFGPLGELGSETSHKLGPIVFGSVPLGDGEKLAWDAAVLFGATNDAPDNTLRLSVEYEFH
jgi:hypothetical protein